jgi:uncharacterized membrane protein
MTRNDAVDAERVLGRVLGLGTRASTVALALGLALALLNPGRAAHLLLHGGLIVLMATPVLRVMVSVVTFARRREWQFVVYTTFVLALLVVGILLASVS